MMFTSAVFAQTTPPLRRSRGTTKDEAESRRDARRPPSKPRRRKPTRQREEEEVEEDREEDEKKKADAPKAADAPPPRGRRAKSRRPKPRQLRKGRVEEVIPPSVCESGLRPRFHFLATKVINENRRRISGGIPPSPLLKRRGHDVVGLFMKNWEDDDETSTAPRART
jgi:hypothetical protein